LWESEAIPGGHLDSDTHNTGYIGSAPQAKVKISFCFSQPFSVTPLVVRKRKYKEKFRVSLLLMNKA